MLNDHEAAVADFMAAARIADPEKHALVCSKYQVKSRRQMRSIAEIEIPVGLHPEVHTGQRVVASASEATYAELTVLEDAS